MIAGLDEASGPESFFRIGLHKSFKTGGSVGYNLAALFPKAFRRITRQSPGVIGTLRVWLGKAAASPVARKLGRLCDTFVEAQTIKSKKQGEKVRPLFINRGIVAFSAGLALLGAAALTTPS